MQTDLGGSVPDEEWTPDIDPSDIATETPVEEEVDPEDTPRPTLDPEPEASPPTAEPEKDRPGLDDLEPLDTTPPEESADEASVSGDSLDHGDVGQQAAGSNDVQADAFTDLDDASDQDVDDEREAEGEEEGDDESNPQPASARRGIDPVLADLLRQEAEYEARVREEEGETLETQPDLGLEVSRPDPRERAQSARDRMVAHREDHDTAPDSREAALAKDRDSRRELLPDIEDISATMRSTDERRPGERAGVGATASEKHRRGFRLGFGLVFLCAALGVLAFIYHAEISTRFPQAAPYVDTYMQKVNKSRLWLDTQVTDVMLYLDGLADNNEAN